MRRAPSIKETFCCLPPPVNQPNGATMVPVPVDNNNAKEEILTFLVPIRKTDEPKAVWKFPTLPLLRKMFEDIRGSTHHLEVCNTAISTSVDPATKVATMVMNTHNFTLFQLIREKIRNYNGIPGIAFNTYERSAFIKQHGVTIYIPNQYKMMPIPLIMGILQKK